MKIRVKKLHPEAVIPNYAKEGDAAVDLTASTGATYVFDGTLGGYAEYGTGLAFEIPKGYVGFLFPRSSISNTNLILSNCVGVLDSGFRGEIKFRFRILSGVEAEYVKGDRIGQLIVLPHPTIELEISDTLSSTERDFGGYGSSGK